MRDAARLLASQPELWIGRVLLLAALVGLVIYSQRDGDFEGYLLVGNQLLNGEDIYATPLNTWPPFFSLICVPLAWLNTVSPYLARGVWILLNYLSLIGVLQVLALSLYQKPFALRPKPEQLCPGSIELWGPVLLTVFYIVSNMEHLQINIILFGLVLSGLYLQLTERDLTGSILIGLAISIKVMPVVVIVYLAYRRRLKAAIYTTAATALFSLSPIVVVGATQFWTDVGHWRDALETGWSVGKMNQSVYAMFDRVLGHGLVPLLTPGIDALPASGATIAQLSWIAMCLVVLGCSFYLFRRQPDPDHVMTLTEWAIVLTVPALFGTVSWKAYLVVLILPNALLFDAWRSRDWPPRTRHVCGGLLLLAFGLGSLHSRELVGRQLSGRFEMASCVTLAALLLLGGMCWYHRELGNRRSGRDSIPASGLG